MSLNSTVVVRSFSSSWSETDIMGTEHFALPKRPINYVSLILLTKKALRAFCSNIYTLALGVMVQLKNLDLTAKAQSSCFLPKRYIICT